MFQGSALIKAREVQGSGTQGTPHQPITDGGISLAGVFGLMESKPTLQTKLTSESSLRLYAGGHRWAPCRIRRTCTSSCTS